MKSIGGIGLCHGSLREVSALDLIGIAGRHGFTSIMLPPGAKAGLPRIDGVGAIQHAGIERVVLDGALAMLPRCPFVERHGLTVDELLRTADHFQVDCFNVPHYQGDPDTSIQEFVDALGPFCEAAGSRGAEVSLEFLPGTGIPDMHRAVRIVESVSAGNLGVTLDTWHWARSGASVEDIRLLPKGVIKDFQVNDRSQLQQKSVDSMQWGRLLPGAGDLPLADIIEAALQNSPGLFLNAEIFSRDLHALDPDVAAGQIFQSMLQLVECIGI